MNLNDSSITTQYQQDLVAFNLDWDPVDTHCMYGTLLIAVSEFLGDAKEKKQPVALTIADLKGNFKLGGIVQYHPNTENPEMPGNWSYVLTFKESDITEANAKVFNSNDIYFQRFFSDAMFNKFGWSFRAFEYIQYTSITAINTLLDWLDKNADPAMVKDIVLEGYFTASVSVEKGKKEFSIVPDGAMKRLIKDDAATALA